ncbi:uncharacterized protein LOC129619128 [Condylostylus longicornis]|uniref:uncharacterized protein LOC129619128 n=1 Tax=Condylostylus longicornis TaxID=2530218 RepID=UPI00244DD6E8|nr:uncharacterized protein LOC129619128 [Condylostylus longicornis]
MLYKLLLIFCLTAVGQAIGYRQAARLCVLRSIEFSKCNDMRQALIDNHLYNRLECTLGTIDECIRKINYNEADVMVLDTKMQHLAFDKGLRSILWELYSNDDVIVALGNENLTLADLKKYPLNFDERDLRLAHSALFFNKIRFGKNTCEIQRSLDQRNSIIFIRQKDLKYGNVIGKKLICRDLTLRDVSDYYVCNFETGPINAILSRVGDFARRGELISIFNELLRYFGPNGCLRNYVQLAGLYQGEHDVIFNEDIQLFSAIRTEINGVTDSDMNAMLCDGNIIEN